MAKEIKAHYPTGNVLYAIVTNATGQVWNTVTPAFETATATIGNYKIALSESSLLSYYTADFPTAITTAGSYDVTIRKQAGGAPATTDVVVGQGGVDWSGSAQSKPVDADTAGKVNLSSTSLTAVLSTFKSDSDIATLIANANGAYTLSLPSSYPGTGTLTLKDKSGVTTLATITLNFDANKVVTSRTVA